VLLQGRRDHADVSLWLICDDHCLLRVFFVYNFTIDPILNFYVSLLSPHMIETAHRKLERDVELSHMMIGNVHESRLSEDV
jgi:hypothetical protein